MKRSTALVALVAAFLASPMARADQCAWNDQEVALRAAESLRQSSSVLTYCEPCGDAAPGEPRAVGRVSVGDVGASHYEVRMEDEGIDLAYTFVQHPDHPGEYVNLGLWSHCRAAGVSPVLRVEDASDTGVLIVPDPDGRIDEPVPVEGQPVEELRGVSDVDATAAPSVPPVGAGDTCEVHVPAWWFFLILLNAVSTLACAIVLVTSARARHHLPRAVALRGERPSAAGAGVPGPTAYAKEAGSIGPPHGSKSS